MSLLLMLTLGSGSVWGATINFNLPNGYYYLGNDAGDNGVPAYDGSNFEANFYMCPAYSTTVNEQNYLGGDSEKPLITTFKSFFDADKNQGKTYSWAVWYIEAATGDNAGYFYIKHRDSGKYLIANDNTLPKAHRRRVNLGPTSEPGNDCLFRIQSDDEGVTYYISSKTKADGSNKYLNPSSANLDNIAATNANDNTGGIIGFWNAKNKNSAWHFVLVPTEKPTITYDNTTNEVTMVSATTGATIYYTTDGSEPDKDHVGGSNPTKQYDPNSKPTISTPTIIKAIAVADSYDVSEVRSLSIQKVETPIKSISATGMIELSSATPFSSIYYTIGNTEPEDPTTSSNLYTVPLDNAVGKYIKAIGVKEGWINSDILSTGLIQLQCATPVITRVGKTFTISCSLPADAAIYYSINGGSETLYSGPVAFTNDQLPMTVTAVAKHSSFTDSEEASVVLHNGSGTPEDPYLISGDTDFTDFVTNVNNGTAADKCFKLIVDVTAGETPITTEYTGVFDGNGYTISGLGHALFNTVNGGVVKNVILDAVNISSGTNVGAIANKVTGTSSKVASVYNCGILSGSVSGSGYVGSIVGQLGDDSNNDNSYARVINCYSYATISGGSSVGGIVGYNSFASAANNLRTMVMNCMFYGKITGGSNKAPIYNGQNITNVGANGLANYNYYFSGCTFTGGIDTYNCALAADERYLTRFEFYRRMLNSNGELAAWYATGSTENRSEMYKWILQPSSYGTEHPFPVLAPQGIYPSVINLDTDNAPTTDEPNKGRNMGTLSVTIQSGSGAQFNAPTGASIVTNHLDLTITDKDYDHFNYNYRKVQLPYYNEVGTGNYTGNRVVTGWKIVSVSGGTTSYSTGDDVEFNDDGSIKSTPYNFADRKCTDKDLYGTGGSNRIFSQGAYWDVPDGVTSITIEPYWGKAAYLCDQYWNVVYSTDHTTSNNVTIMGEHYHDGTSYDIAGSSQKVYNTLSNAVDALSSDASHSVYDYAVVLVGNYHLVKQAASINDGTKPFTVMSADFDYDNEPDYSFILQFSSRQNTAPIRFDFINIPGLGMAQKSYEATSMPNVGIFKPSGWFEITNTTTILLGQFEYDRGAKVLAPLILHGGIIEQIVSNNDGNTALTKTQYIHMGSNVWLASFTPGIHQDRTAATKHVPVSVTGGEYQEFHLTGMYRADASIYNDDAECYIHGGKFGEITGTGLEGIGSPTNHTKGNITWLIDQADITNFFGGGINAAKPSQGNIYTEITNSNVTLFCGGPKFGDMQTGRTVTTKAKDCTFGTFFGAGYGGNSYNRFSPKNKTDSINYNWNKWINANYTCNYSSDADKNGISTEFAYEFIPMSGGMTTNVARLFVNYLSFSLATTGSVTSTLTGCKVTGNFYGGGSLGKVNGNATSTLTNCTLEQSAFGAGFSATLPTVEVMATGGFATEPEYDPDGGVYSQGVFPNTTTYTWKQATSPSIDKDKHILYTTADLTSLGTVTGNVTLTINGTTTTVKHSVYGGGEESGVGGNTTVSVTGGTIGTAGLGGAEYGNVYGGGKGKEDNVKAGLVKGNTNVTISGSPRIYHNIYGGGAFGSVGNFDYDTNNTITGTTGITTDATTGKLTSGLCTVKVIGGTIGTTGMDNGMVFGSSRGAEGDPDVDSNIDKLAWVYDTEVVIGTQGSSSGPHIKGSVYGGGENGHNYHNASVTVHGGKIGLDATNDPDGGARYPYRGNVYGGGCGTDTYDRVVEVGGEEKTCTYYNFNAGIVRGNATVTIDGGHVVHNVYGAGAMGSVGTFTMLDYNDGGEGEAYHDAHPEVPEGKPYKCAENTGLCTVTISGGEIGENGMQMTAQGGPDDFGHVFGAGRGEVPKVRARLNEEVADSLNYPNLRLVGFVNKTKLTIKDNAFVKGSVYGGSESGHVLHDTWVKIDGGQIGCGEGQTAAYTDFASESLAGTAHWPYSNNGNPYDQYANADGDYPGVDRDEDGLPSAKGGLASATDGHTFYGNVFGGGSGYYPYAPGKWMRSSGWVEGNTIVEITGGHILNNVYGGCEMADVNGSATVNMSGGTVGVPRTTGEIVGNPTLGHVFGAGMGDKRIFFNTSTNVASTSVNISGGTVYGSVYGGGEDGHVMGNAETTISQAENKTTKIGTRGTVEGFDGNVFGGGQGSSTALTAGVVGGNVKLKIQGGTMLGSVYGGGRIASVGTFFAMASDERYGKMHYDDEGGTYESGTHGHLTIDLTGGTVNQDVYGGCMGTTENEQLGESKTVLLELNKDVDDDKKGCVVKGNIFGCNNVFSSPLDSVTVNIYGTQNADKSQIANTTASGNTPAVSDAKRMGKYDVKAVYGGGNMAAYVPTDAFSTNEDTKAAAHTFVNIYGCGRTSIQQVYGGGNAASTPATEVTVYGTYEIEELFGGGNGKDALPDGSANPGANVGFKNYSAVETDERWDTKEERETNADFIRDYVYGSGKASLNVYGGTIHRVFGGSNTKGNVRKTAITMLEDRSECEFNVDEAYGGGKSAPMDAEAQLLMACIPGLSVAYGGAEAADIQGGVTLNITNGKFDRIFGGNNKSGTIRGPIKINIEETGCRPIIIGELYGGGNLAGYSIYGYKDVDDEGRKVTDSNGKTMWFPRRTPTDGGTVAITPYANPEVNVKSFTSIGDIYGGGYGESAVMVGDPTVNINVVMGDKTNDDAAEIGENAVTHTENGYPIPSHAKGKIGAINNVFGGGNAAPVIGDTHVNIGTEPTVTYLTGDKAEHDVIGADIRGNVYGGGNAAEVTGSTHVTIGKQATTN